MIDRPAIAAKRVHGMRPLGVVAGYDVLVSGEPILFVDPARCPTIDDFLLGFSGLGAWCACIAPNGDVLFGCDLYGLTEYYYQVEEHRIIVAPTLERLVATGHGSLDEGSLFELFFTGVIYGSGTPFEGIAKSCPLSVLEIRFRGDAVQCRRRDVLPADAPAGPFSDAIGSAAATVARSARRLQLNFSGGADSSAILQALRGCGASFAAAHCLLYDRELSMAYGRLADTGIPLHIVIPRRQLKCVDLVYRPCAIHTSPEFALELADLARSTEADLVVTGQNADAMAEFGNTQTVAIPDLAASLLLDGLCGTAMSALLARAIEKFPDGVPGLFRRAYAKAASLNGCSTDFELAFLSAMTCRRRPTPMWYPPEQLSFLSWELRRAWLRRIEQDVLQVHENPRLSFRQKLFVIQFRNYLIGGDVRCLTTAAARAGVRNVQLYTTPPMVRYFFNAEPSVRDVLRPKTTIRRYTRWTPGPRIGRKEILTDGGGRVTVREAAYRLIGRHDDRPVAEKLQALSARFPWISRASLEALRPLRGPSWRLRASHLFALVHGEYAPVWFEDSGALTP